MAKSSKQFHVFIRWFYLSDRFTFIDGDHDTTNLPGAVSTMIDKARAEAKARMAEKKAPAGCSAYKIIFRTIEDWELGSEPIPVHINAKEVMVEKSSLTYAEIVALAGMTGNPTVVWCKRGTQEGGILYGDKSVLIVPGLSIDCCHTGNA